MVALWTNHHQSDIPDVSAAHNEAGVEVQRGRFRHQPCCPRLAGDLHQP
jgi:hypothetical protein